MTHLRNMSENVLKKNTRTHVHVFKLLEPTYIHYYHGNRLLMITIYLRFLSTTSRVYRPCRIFGFNPRHLFNGSTRSSIHHSRANIYFLIRTLHFETCLNVPIIIKYIRVVVTIFGGMSYINTQYTVKRFFLY